MIWLGAALLLFAASGIAIASVRHLRRRRAAPVAVAEDLATRVVAATRAFAAAPPWQPSSASDAPAAAAAIEAALIAGEPGRALEAAESALAAAPEDPAARVWLAWALCANGQPAGALDQLGRGGDGPLAAYVAARAEHLQFEHGSGATGAVPPLVTTGDLAVVTLAGGRGAAAWLTGATDVQLTADQVRAAVGEHREVTARCLAAALDALDAAPGFTDAAYLVARLAVKAGLVPAARGLFDALAPRIAGRPDADAFERDRRDLDDPSGAVAAAKSPPPPASSKAKRSRSLRVLS
jgi:thioredoxin-like negative regulator of GroEL